MSMTSDETGTDAGRRPVPDGVTPEEYIAAIPMWTRKKNSLADIRKFLAALDVSEKNIIHVAGTNGKGSVCAYLTAALNAARYTTGTFVSPHLRDVKERFLIDGEPVGEEDFCAAFDSVLSVVERKCAEGLAHPSYFEFCFLMAMTIFTRKDVDFRILETGLGGRLDATNAVNCALACVITSISLDHTQYLGGTIKEIAAEKAGIIKPKVPVIYDADDDRAARIIEKKADDNDSPAFPVYSRAAESAEDSVSRIMARYGAGLSFSAPYQKKDAALALRTLEVLRIPGITPSAVHDGFSSLNWQGRMEEAAPGIWLDGAHNPGGIKAFIKAVKEQRQVSGPFDIHLIFASSNDKNYPAMIHHLCEELSPGYVTVTAFEGERAADADELAALFEREGVRNLRAVDTPREAVASALSQLELSRREEETRLFITGSLYLIGAVRQYFI